MRKNADLLRHIVRYCDEINEAVEHFGNSFEALQLSSSYRNATAMCIFQIGEISVHLSDDFKAENYAIPWKQIRGMRNIAAHSYGTFSLKQLWSTITDDVPVLRDYCEKILREYDLCSQDAVEAPKED